MYFDGTRFWISENAGSFIPIDGYFLGTQRIQFSLDTAALQAGGATLSHQYVLGNLPGNAQLLGCEISVNQGINGIGFVSATATLEGNGDAPGAVIAATSVATGGVLKAPVGSNPYVSRSGQQMLTTITLVGVNLSAITAGNLTFNLFYSLAP